MEEQVEIIFPSKLLKMMQNFCNIEGAKLSNAHADINAAKNILAACPAAIACGETVQQGRSMKQEPNRKAAQAA